MSYFRLFLIVTLLLQGLYSAAINFDESELSCPLPPPGWITAPEITSSTIKISWEGVLGATHYKVSRFDVTNNVQLPDTITTEPEYISGPHDPGTTISFEVRATACGQNGDYGSPVTGEFTTNVIIVDVVGSFSAPNLPMGNIPIYPGGTSQSMPAKATDANQNTEEVTVMRYKIRTLNQQNSPVDSVEFLFWSECSTPQLGVARIMYWNQSNWSSGITFVENHVGGGASGPIYSINFRIGTSPFFTIMNPEFDAGVNGAPNSMQVLIRNDRTETIYVSRSSNIEDNPCYAPPKRMRQKVDYISANDHAAQDRESTLAKHGAPILAISPNPCSEGFRAEYVLSEQSPVVFTLFDASGRVVRTMNLPTLEAGTYNTYISTEHLPTGVFLLSMQTNQGRSVTTVVKQY
jgi:hypothetical protein